MKAPLALSLLALAPLLQQCSSPDKAEPEPSLGVAAEPMTSEVSAPESMEPAPTSDEPATDEPTATEPTASDTDPVATDTTATDEVAVAEEPSADSTDATESATVDPVSTEAVVAAPVASESMMDEVSEFGAPLFVNGERISDLAIKRFLCYGAGRTALESRKLDVLVQQELAIRASGGEDVSQYEISEEEFDAAYTTEIGEFKDRYPTLDEETEIGRAYKSVDWYKAQLRQTLEFDRLFFHGDPETWPDVTKEAVYAGSPQVDLVKDAKENYDRRVLRAEETGEPLVEEDDMFRGLLRDYVIESLNSIVDVQTAFDGLPEELLMVIEGGGFRAEIKTEEFYDEIKSAFGPDDVMNAKHFLALMAAAEDRLEEEGGLIPAEEFSATIRKLSGDLKTTIFSFDFLALHGHQFPSTEAYKQHMRFVESYKKMLESEMEMGENGELPPALSDHLLIANTVMGLARADAEVLLISAYDFYNNRWKEDGWATAKSKAIDLRERIDTHIEKLAVDAEARKAAAARGEDYEPEEEILPFARFWAELVDLNSDYWDPPMPSSGKMPPMVGMKQKGRFGLMTRNDLERAIGESPYLQFLFGSSITDAIFFDMQTGSTEGPYAGPKGYYIIHLRTRTSPTNPLNINEPKHIDLLKEDFVRREFVKYAHEALEQADVKGLEPMPM